MSFSRSFRTPLPNRLLPGSELPGYCRLSLWDKKPRGVFDFLPQHVRKGTDEIPAIIMIAENAVEIVAEITLDATRIIKPYESNVS